MISTLLGGTLAETREHAAGAASFAPFDAGLAAFDVFDVSYAGFGGHRVRGWYIRPEVSSASWAMAAPW